MAGGCLPSWAAAHVRSGWGLGWGEPREAEGKLIKENRLDFVDR